MQPGYYWVNYRGTWMPAEYHGGNGHWWSLIGYDGPVAEEELQEIGERLEH